MTDKQTPTDAATPECLTCSDHGAVGNILTAEPCPDCTRLNTQPAPAQPDQPIACSYGDNGYACCEGGPCQADVHNDKLAEQQAPAGAQAEESVPAPAPPPECETEAEKRAFAFGWFKALESERMKAESVPKAQFDDPKVQAVYAILCNGAGKQGGQHGTE